MVVTGPPRTPSGLVAELGGYGVATVHEALGRRGLLGADLRPAWPGARAAGTAVTALCLPGDNLTVHVAVELTGPGDVLVVTTTEPSLEGYIGELLTTSLAARGVTGLVTTTGIRDVADIAAAGFPAWSRAVNAQGAVKGAVGQVNRPVRSAARPWARATPSWPTPTGWCAYRVPGRGRGGGGLRAAGTA